MELIEAGAGVRIAGIGNATIVPRAAARRSRGGAVGAEEVVDLAFDTDDQSVVADVTIAPGPLRDARRRGGAAAPAFAPRVEVEVQPGEGAVVLVERGSSVFQWVFPQDAAAAAPTRRRAAGPETLIFALDEIDVDMAGPAAARRRGIIHTVANQLIEPIRVRVVRYLAAKTIDAALARIEGDLVEGPVDMASEAAGWVATGPHLAAAPTLPAGRAPRVLLMVHGTFSTTRGSFGALEKTEEGKAFLAMARARYDLVIGFDHRTLAVTPGANAQGIVTALDFLPADTRIDAIAFSRGGLVLRSFAELTRDHFRFGRAIYVGCTNAGTHLAEPANWRTLVDLYTSILVAGSRMLTLAGGGAVGFWAEQAIRTVSRFVQALPELAIEEGRVPGLAAMRPGGEVVVTLGRAAPFVPAIETCVIASDFEPRIQPDRAITGELAEFLADRVIDRLFTDDNDLVVDTASMANFGTSCPAPTGDRLLLLPVADAIYHVIYFASGKVAVQLTEWLSAEPEVEAVASARRSPASRTPPARRARTMRGGFDRSSGDAARFDAPIHGVGAPDVGAIYDDAVGNVGFAQVLGDHLKIEPEPEAVAVAPVPAVASPPIPSPVQPSCYFAAEMGSTPPLAAPTPLFVTISRDRIAVAVGSSAAETPDAVPVAPDVPITVIAVGLANCRIVGADRYEVDVPARTVSLRFVVEGEGPGVAQVQVYARQGPQTLASFVLEPVFVASDTDKITASAHVVTNTLAPGKAATMRIYELQQPDGSMMIRYDLVGPRIAETYTKTLSGDFSMKAFVGELLAQLDGAYDKDKVEYDAFLERIGSFMVDSTNQLMPEEVREALWEHRDNIDAIHVISDSPYVPWELLYIDDPKGGGVESRGFLCEWGLVRWMYNANLPEDRLQLRPDRVRYVIPDYLNESDKLPEADAERAMLSDRFSGAAAIHASSAAVSDFLHDEAKDCDLLHFACHGEARQMAVLSSDLVLSGLRTTAGTVADDLLGSSAVKRYARFGGEVPSGLVFINACQTGQPGEGIAGVSGFADAFLRPTSRQGAAVFVGALWSVGDTLARTFATTLYDRLLAGDTLVAATKAARTACKSDNDFTWLAYSVYGNPFARCS